ncbi:hypothetical protein DFP94_103455 [Fontibacillus phaseoli]|uniref:Uncharacterized protein n=1 Tax=Fontibacillus phaseoli TaxID=1416533 RepID=A0A369BGP8_9BACL|nr:hypothetical protein DFP94_103455 [Fontibacillus phaseoli]
MNPVKRGRRADGQDFKQMKAKKDRYPFAVFLEGLFIHPYSRNRNIERHEARPLTPMSI